MTLSQFDNEIRKDYNVVCGCDEAGRGPLAGDVFAAAVIFDKDTVIELSLIHISEPTRPY